MSTDKPITPGTDWQSIATAPRDGTIIDLWMRSYFWNADGNRQVAVEMRIPDAKWFDNQWTNADGNPHDYLEGFPDAEIEYWRSVPTPPPEASST